MYVSGIAPANTPACVPLNPSASVTDERYAGSENHTNNSAPYPIPPTESRAAFSILVGRRVIGSPFGTTAYMCCRPATPTGPYASGRNVRHGLDVHL